MNRLPLRRRRFGRTADHEEAGIELVLGAGNFVTGPPKGHSLAIGKYVGEVMNTDDASSKVTPCFLTFAAANPNWSQSHPTDERYFSFRCRQHSSCH